MSTHQPETINELIALTKRRLGEDPNDPDRSYIQIDLSDDQMRDIVYYCLQKYQSEHFSGSRRMLHFVTLQQGVQEYKLPNDTLAVLGYLDNADRNSMFSLDYQTRQQFGMQFSQFDVVSVEVTYEYLDLVNYKISKKVDWEFNALTKKLVIQNTDQEEPRKIAVLAYNTNGPINTPNIFNELWLKDYTYACTKVMLGETLKKFGNVKLPGGITINAQEIYNEGVALKEKLEKELETKWSRPPMLFVG